MTYKKIIKIRNLKRIIWLHSIFSEYYLKKSPAGSPAANVWQHKFIDNLKKLNIDILTILLHKVVWVFCLKLKI